MVMNRHSFVVFAGRHLLLAAALSLGAGASSAMAQTATEADAATAAGWVLTPTLVFATSHDNNVLAKGVGDQPQGDLINVLNPRATIDYRGRRSQFSGNYDGAIALYRSLSTLNSYDQRAGVRMGRRFSPHVSIFADSALSVSPTTGSLQLAGVPFVRTGSTLKDLRGGVTAAFTKRTSMVAGVNFESVHFDEDRPLDLILRGGYSQGGSLTLRHRLSARTSVTGDYSLQRAVVANGQADFRVQDGTVGFEHMLSDRFQGYGAIGLAHLGLSTFGPPRTGLSYRAGLTSRLRLLTAEVSYNRSFIPSFGFGGTMQNQDFTALARATPSRRTSVQSSLSWRRNDPLTRGDLSLRTLSWQVTGGYAIQPWARIEGFYGSLSNTIDRPGGLIDRRQFGFQIVTAQPIRIR
jgi:hypothetical protein